MPPRIATVAKRLFMIETETITEEWIRLLRTRDWSGTSALAWDYTELQSRALVNEANSSNEDQREMWAAESEITYFLLQREVSNFGH